MWCLVYIIIKLFYGFLCIFVTNKSQFFSCDLKVFIFIAYSCSLFKSIKMTLLPLAHNHFHTAQNWNADAFFSLCSCFSIFIKCMPYKYRMYDKSSEPNVGGYYHYITRLSCITLPPIHLKQFHFNFSILIFNIDYERFFRFW